MTFVFSIFLFAITGAFCSAVANEKGYNAFGWFILGFLFNFVALIAVVGMPDRKLRKYIRQIGEKQKATEKESEGAESEGAEWVEQSSDWGSTIQFVMPTSSNEEEIYKRLISEIGRNKAVKKKFDKLKIETYEFSESLLGGREFVLLGKDLRTLFVMTGKELNAIEYQWTGEF